jgi:hypothetical protein
MLKCWQNAGVSKPNCKYFDTKMLVFSPQYVDILQQNAGIFTPKLNYFDAKMHHFVTKLHRFKDTIEVL